MKTKINLQHIVYSPKYRRPILVNEVAAECEKRIREICQKKGMLLHEIALQEDHVHIFLQIPHTMPVCKAVQLIKWYSSCHVRRVFPRLKENSPKYFWQRNYWSRSVGGDEKRVREYITNQMNRLHKQGATK